MFDITEEIEYKDKVLLSFILTATMQTAFLSETIATELLGYDKKMFSKRAVIITQSIGAPNGAAQKDVATSLTWFGVSDIKRVGFGTMGSVKWDEINGKRRRKVEGKVSL